MPFQSGFRRAGRACAVSALTLTALLGGGTPAASARPALGVDDPLASLQWHLKRDGLRSAWARTTGGPITVAVIDSGVDMGHPDLRPNLWTNRGEVAGNGIDDDGNGFVDDVHGYDFVAGDGDPADEHGHGTHVAGILAARGDNGIGVSGVAQRARVMVVRALDAQNNGNTAWLAAAIDYAVTNGARVLNVSINTLADAPEVDAAIARAGAAGVLLVVSAGNDGADLDVTPSYPACSAAPNVVTVGSVGRDGERSAFSNHGSCVDVTAPGDDIVATRAGGGYERRSGTSMAAPQVSGAAVLAISADRHLAATRLVAALTSAATRRNAAGATSPSGPPSLSAGRLLARLRTVR